MAILNEDGFRKKLKSDPPHGLFCIYGEDTYLKDFYLKKLTDAAVDPSLAAFNLRVFTRDERDLTDIFEAVEALPMMSEYQCVLIRDYPVYDLNKDDFESLQKEIANLPEGIKEGDLFLITDGKAEILHDETAEKKKRMADC